MVACEDHLGNRFSSLTEMCEFHGLPRRVFYDRRARGLSVRMCLNPKVEQRRGSGRLEGYTDHLGNKYGTAKVMCKAHGVPYHVYMTRYCTGHSIEECLAPVTPRRRHCKDHLGNEFKTVTDMCRYHNVGIALYCKRVSRGMSLEDCLYSGKLAKRSVMYKDHLGNEFSSLSSMCAFHATSIESYTYRKAQGKSLEECLGGSVFACVDDKGNKFKNQAEMCRFHGVSYNTYMKRKVNGCELSECLRSARKTKNYKKSTQDKE